jgi:hypothetical protein
VTADELFDEVAVLPAKTKTSGEILRILKCPGPVAVKRTERIDR